MAILRGMPRRGRRPSLTGKVMIDSVRGVLRVRKWPRKRGTPKSESQLWWIDWFRQANFLAKYADGMSQVRAKEMTKGSGMYPRDVILMAMRGRLYTWVDSTGWRWYPVAAIDDISESLDVLAQTIGSVLVRAADRWRAAVPGSIGDVLTYRGSAAAPEWSPPSAGGLVTSELAGTPIVPDGSVGEYDFDVSGYAAVEFTMDDVTLSGSASIFFRFSTDGGATFRDGAVDYRVVLVDKASEITADISAIDFNDGAGSSGIYGSARVENLRAGRAVVRGFVTNGASARMINGFPHFDGPVTDIRLLALGGPTFTGGTIRAVGFLA